MQDYSNDPFHGKIVQTAPNTFEADEQIIKSIVAAREVYNKLRENHIKRIIFYTEVEGLLAGAPPYDPKEMRAAGLQHVANYNDMSCRATYERYCQAYWNLLYNSQFMVNFVLRLQDPTQAEWAISLSRNWDIVVKKHWPSFHVNVASLTAQLVKFGVSPALFSDERSPAWRVVEMNRFFVPDAAQSDLDMLTTICVESEFTVQYLWGVFQETKNKKFGTETPWNHEELARVLILLANTYSKDSAGPDDEFETRRKIYSGDTSFDRMFNDCVRIVSLLQREYDGTISHYMFHRHYNYQMPPQGVTGDGFLFYQHAQYDSMQEAVTIFTMTPGEYTIHANRGLGHKIYSLGQASVMMDCSIVDGARFAATPIIKSSSLNPNDVDQIRFIPGVPTNIGTAEFVQNNLGTNMQHIISVAQYLKQQMQVNLTYSGSDPASPDPDKGSLSPSQVRISAFRELNVLKNSILHFYNTFDRILQNMTDKMFRSKEGYPYYDMAKEWKELCIEDGVPEKVFEIATKKKKGFPKEIQVMATRVAGAGSQIGLLMGLEALEPITGSFTQEEQEAYKKLYVTAAIGPEYIDTFAQPLKPDEQGAGSSLAGLENGLIKLGGAPVFEIDNDHRMHFGTHLALGQWVKMQLQPTGPGQATGELDIQKAATMLSVLVPHMAEHFASLAQNPFAQAFVERYKPYMSDMAQFTSLIVANAQKAAEAEAQQQELNAANEQRAQSEEELKQFTTINDEKRKDFKLLRQNQRQQEQHATKQQMAATKVAGDLQIKAAVAKGDHAIELQKITNDLQVKTINGNQAASGEKKSPSEKTE